MARKVALVTGAAKRMGRAIATRLAGDGFAVALHYNSSRRDAEALAESITAAGGAAHLVEADLADPSSARRLIASCIGAFGGLDLLVNNAAIFEHDDVATLDLQRWRRQFAINLEAPVFLAAAFSASLPRVAEGAIVNIIDGRVLRLTPQNISYTLAKSALWTATQTLAQALAPRIRVNAVGPGPTFPNSSQGDAGLKHEAEGVLLKRAVAGEDIADAVAWLAAARSITGQLIAVDSGQHLAWRTPDIID
jgi:NAD(P)-dependent dehydrogenase (short-subunit alcohol dehydrogenase family)